ncbi:hypothetical protein YC2023_024768 [Brassica napus]
MELATAFGDPKENMCASNQSLGVELWANRFLQSVVSCIIKGSFSCGNASLVENQRLVYRERTEFLEFHLTNNSVKPLVSLPERLRSVKVDSVFSYKGKILTTGYSNSPLLITIKKLNRKDEGLQDSKNHSSDNTWLQKKCCNASQIIYRGFSKDILYWDIIPSYMDSLVSLKGVHVAVTKICVSPTLIPELRLVIRVCAAGVHRGESHVLRKRKNIKISITKDLGSSRLSRVNPDRDCSVGSTPLDGYGWYLASDRHYLSFSSVEPLIPPLKT